MLNQLWRTLFILILSVQFAAAQAIELAVTCSPITGRVFYTVKDHDRLADILQDFEVGKPLWGAERSYVLKVARLNQLQSPNLIFVGDTIDLPFACEENLLKFEVTQKKNGREVNLKTNRVIASDEKAETSVPVASIAKAQTELPEVHDHTKDFKTFSRLHAASSYNFYSINSESSSSGSSAFLLSEPSLGVNLSWEQVWSEQFSTKFSTSQTTVQMHDASSGTVDGGNNTLSKVGFGLDYSVISNLILKVDSSFGNQLFARAISPGKATLDSVYVSRLGFSLVPTLIQKGALSLGCQIGYFQILPTSTKDYSLKTGDGFIVAPRVRHKLNQLNLELELNYEDSRQDSNISSQKNKHVGIQFGLSYELGQ